MSRADNFTITKQMPEFYSDFMVDFSLNPITGNLARMTNENAIKQSIRNIIMTMNGERPFQMTLGSKCASLLFDPIDTVTEDLVKTTVIYAIQNHEPRAKLISVDVTASDDNTYNVVITFTVINIPNQEFSMAVLVRRVR